jgi:hypothetical protein
METQKIFHHACMHAKKSSLRKTQNPSTYN